TEKLQRNSIAIFHSSDEFPRSGDQHFPFKQNADIFYLSGIDQEKSILVLFPDTPDPKFRKALFLLKTDEHIAVWEGHKYTKEAATQVSSIQLVFWLDSFDRVLPTLLHYAENICLNSNENHSFVLTVPYRDLRFELDPMNRFPFHQYARPP